MNFARTKYSMSFNIHLCLERITFRITVISTRHNSMFIYNHTSKVMPRIIRQFTHCARSFEVRLLSFTQHNGQENWSLGRHLPKEGENSLTWGHNPSWL